MEIGRIMNTNAHIHVGITIKTIQKFTTKKFINQMPDLRLHANGLNSYLQVHVREVIRRFSSTFWV